MRILLIICIYLVVGCAGTGSGGNSGGAPSSTHGNAKISRLGNAIELEKFKGRSFLEAMQAPDGIKKAIDDDENIELTIRASRIRNADTTFDKRLLAKVKNLFATPDGWDKLISALDGQKLKANDVAMATSKKLFELKLLKDQSKTIFVGVAASPFIALASGAGIMVKLDPTNANYHIGFKPGSSVKIDLDRHVRSGHSYGMGPDHGVLEILDVDVLNEAARALAKDKSVEDFYRTLLSVLISCDTSGLAKLPAAQQTLLTDFMAVYTAELDRHMMTGMKFHSGQNDIAEILFLAAYGAAAERVEKKGHLIPGSIADFFAVGPRGGGISETAADRKKLQRDLTSVMRRTHQDLVEDLERVIGAGNSSDIFNALVVFLNDPDKNQRLRMGSDDILANATRFFAALHQDHEKLTARLN